MYIFSGLGLEKSGPEQKSDGPPPLKATSAVLIVRRGKNECGAKPWVILFVALKFNYSKSYRDILEMRPPFERT